MYHSIWIGDYNTFDRWGMVPTSRPVVNMPEVKTKIVDLPGTDSVLDYTSLLMGRPAYGRRSGTWEFWLRPESNWHNVHLDLANYIHGQERDCILEDDPKYMYTGRLTLDEWRSDQKNSIVVIKYDFDPFKRSVWNSSDEDWMFDPTIEQDLPIYYGDFAVNGEMVRTLNYDSSNFPSSLEIVTDSHMTVEFDGITHNLIPGSNYKATLAITADNNVLTFKGNGNVTISYREMKL